MTVRVRSLVIATVAGLSALAMAAPAQATFPGPNGRIAYRQFDPAIGDFVLFTANPDGSHPLQVTDTGGFFSNWSADGKHLAYDFYDTDGNEQIATVNPDGTGMQQLTFGPVIHEAPSFSPDGSRIVYDYAPDFGPDFHTSLWIMNADGTDQQPLVQGQETFDVEPAFSPDGRSIAFVRFRPIAEPPFQLNALFVMRSDGTDARRVTSWNLSVELGNGAWSPNGRWLTYYTHADDGGVRSISLVRPDGHGNHRIFRGHWAADGVRPAFSPDGTKIMFVCVTHPHKPKFNGDICVMNTDGLDVEYVTNTPWPMLEKNPSWGTSPLIP